jgi:hypothetical protein
VSAPTLGPELATRLRALVRQLDPDADAEAVVAELARRLPAAAVPSLSPDLLSVVVRHHALDRLPLLDEALFSLACSEHRPLEIVLASQAPEPGARERLDALLARHVALAGDAVEGRLVHAPSGRDERGRLANLGAAAAHGRYLAFLDDDDVVYPGHHAGLVAALRGGEAAWAIGRARRVDVATAPGGGLHVRAKAPWPPADPFTLPRIARDNHVPVHAFVLDRERLRGLRVAFSETLPRQEDYALLLRIAAVFRPAIVAGPPTCEYRFRDDGSNTTPVAGAPLAARLARAWTWSATAEPITRERDAVQALASMAELAALDTPAATAGARDELRYRLADRLNAAVKRLPGVHALLKATLAKRG